MWFNWSYPKDDENDYFGWQRFNHATEYFTTAFHDQYKMELVKYDHHLVKLGITKQEFERIILTLTHFVSFVSDNNNISAQYKVNLCEKNKIVMTHDKAIHLPHSDFKAQTGLLILGLSFLLETGIIQIEAGTFLGLCASCIYVQTYHHMVYHF